MLQRAMLERLTALLASVLGAQVPLAVAALEGMCLLLEVLGEVSPEQLASLEEPVVGKLLSGSACLRRQVRRPMRMQVLQQVLMQRTYYVLRIRMGSASIRHRSFTLFLAAYRKELVPGQCQTLALTSTRLLLCPERAPQTADTASPGWSTDNVASRLEAQMATVA